MMLLESLNISLNRKCILFQYIDIGRCEAGWQLFGDSCYYFSNERATSWQVSEDICVQMNAQLVSIHSAEEQSFITSECYNYLFYGKYFLRWNCTVTQNLVCSAI